MSGREAIDEELVMSVEAYGRRNFVLSVRRSMLVWFVAAIPTAVALSSVISVGSWTLVCVVAAYALGASLGVDTGRRGADGGLSSARRRFVWVLSRGDMRGGLAFVLLVAGVWWGYETFRSVAGLHALVGAWPGTDPLADTQAQVAAVEGLIADVSAVRERIVIIGIAMAALGLSGVFWSGALDGVWLGSASARMGLSWRQLLFGRRAWREWERSRDERRWTYLGGAG